jgi:hypothetical protein
VYEFIASRSYLSPSRPPPTTKPSTPTTTTSGTMSGFRDPYANQGANYMQHSYNDSDEYYNPYQQQPAQVDRSNTMRSRYGGEQFPQDNSSRTLPALPTEEPQGFKTANVLRRQSTRASYSNPLNRSELRQSLTPLTRAPGG